MLPSMRVIVFASQKGGSGKTTLAGHLAVQAALSGAGPVGLIDMDPQGSLAKWWNVRRSDEPAFIQSVFSNLYQDLAQARSRGFRLVIVDTPPAITRALTEVISVADLVVLPTRPSPHDLYAIGATVDIVESMDKQMVFVINDATPRARITSEMAVALSQHGTVAPITIHNRVDFAASMTDGRTVMETNSKGLASREISQLWSYIRDRIRRTETIQPGGIKSNGRADVATNVNVLGRRAPLFGQRVVQ